MAQLPALLILLVTTAKIHFEEQALLMAQNKAGRVARQAGR
jgi:hypothetical protein